MTKIVGKKIAKSKNIRLNHPNGKSVVEETRTERTEADCLVLRL